MMYGKLADISAASRVSAAYVPCALAPIGLHIFDPKLLYDNSCTLKWTSSKLACTIIVSWPSF